MKKDTSEKKAYDRSIAIKIIKIISSQDEKILC